jgi:hypothetical protein
LERDAHSLKGPVHGLNVLGLESESTGSGPYHHGAADGLELAPPRRSHATARYRQICDGHEELWSGTTRVPRLAIRRRSDTAPRPRQSSFM